MIQNINEKDLNGFTEKDLEDALQVITSLVNKCEKAQLKLVHRISQSTLLINRINALSIATALISKELRNIQSNGIENNKPEL